MKKLYLTVMLFMLFFIMVVTFQTFTEEEYHISINFDRTGIYSLKGGYHAYWINYSHGKQYLGNGKTKNYWHWPTFSRCDIRGLILTKEEVKT